MQISRVFSFFSQDYALFHCWKANRSLRQSRNLLTPTKTAIFTSLFYACNPFQKVRYFVWPQNCNQREIKPRPAPHSQNYYGHSPENKWWLIGYYLWQRTVHYSNKEWRTITWDFSNWVHQSVVLSKRLSRFSNVDVVRDKLPSSMIVPKTVPN